IKSIYVPPTDQEVAKSLLKHINKKYNQYNKKNRYFILLGDLNSCADTNIDYNGHSKNKKKPSEILTWLDTHHYADTFRIHNPKLRRYTWSNGNIKTRIDYIFCDPKLSNYVTNSKIHKSADITDSDHEITHTIFNVQRFMHQPSHNVKRMNKREKTFIYDYDKAKEKDWDKYNESLVNIL